MTTILVGTTSALDNAAAVRVGLEELGLATDALRRDPGTPVLLTAEFADANSYARVLVSGVRAVNIDGGDYLALAGQITDMGTSFSSSAGCTLSERCTLIVPTSLHQGGAPCYLLPGEYRF